MARCKSCGVGDGKHNKDCPALPELLDEALKRKWNEQAGEIAKGLGIYLPGLMTYGDSIVLMTHAISLRMKLAEKDELLEWMDTALGLAAQLHGALKALTPSPESLPAEDRANWQIVIDIIFKSADYIKTMPKALKDRPTRKGMHSIGIRN